jgi:glycerol-3-phosphate O-acyltransferase
MTFRNPVNYIARKLLYWMVRAEVLPSNIESVNITREVPVIYVLEARNWSNLLVLEAECDRLGLPAPINRIPEPNLKAWHCVYSVAPRQPFKAWLQQTPKRSRMLRGIIEILRENPEQEIQFLPVSIFWGRPVAVQKHWMQVLFADTWGIAGRTRRFFTILFHGRSTLVNFSETISYRGSTFLEHTDDELIDRLQSHLAKHFVDQRTATLGPDVSHRRTLLRTLILKPAVQKSIVKRSQEDGLSEYKASLQARRYLNEIVANCTNITLQLMQRSLTAFWYKFYSGIEIGNSDYLKTLALTHELIYVPCHRSHIDYLLLSYIIHSKGLAIPYIAAGKNLNMPIIGSILRGAGAFFIRRSFKGNELYSTVMFEYIAELISSGMPIEYFVEGGRSRTGRLLRARPGLLSMTVRGFLKYKERPIAFIPVYIGYERLMEGKAYQAELSGEDKKSETFLSSIRSIVNIRGAYGKVYTNFAKPVFLNQALDDKHSSWSSEVYDEVARPEWIRKVVTDTSEKIMCHINQAANVNAINLISTIMLATPKQAMDEVELVELVEVYRIIIDALNYSNHIDLVNNTGKAQIEHAESLKMIKRRRHEFGDIMYLDAKHSVSLTYFKNNTLHLFALPSVIACCFTNVRVLKRVKVIELVSLVYPFLKNELYLTWQVDELPRLVSKILTTLSEYGFLSENTENDSYARPGSGAKRHRHLNLLEKIITPVLEVYYLSLVILARSEFNVVSIQDLEKKCYLMAQRVAMIHKLNSPDYSDKRLVSNFINELVHGDYLRLYENEHLEYGEGFYDTNRHLRLLLGKEVRMNILQMVKS